MYKEDIFIKKFQNQVSSNNEIPYFAFLKWETENVSRQEGQFKLI